MFQDNVILEDLRRSGLDKEIIEEMAIRPIKDREDLKECVGLATKDGQSILQATQAYYLPYLCATEKFGRVKLLHALDGQKYISPVSNICENNKHLYFLEKEAEKLSKSHFPLVIVEGEKKAAKVTQELRKSGNFAVVGIAGVDMWNGCPEWSKVVVSCRDIYIIFDSDWKTKPNVQIALIKLFLFLKRKKGNVKVVSFDTKNKGIDDHLVCFGAKAGDELLSLMQKAGNEIWGDNINYYKLSEILAESKYSVDVDCKAVFEEYRLKDKYSISFSTFKSTVKKAYADFFAKEMAEKKPVIKTDGGFLTENLRKVDAILRETGEIFQQNRRLVRAVQVVENLKDGRPTNTWAIQPVSSYYIMKLLSEKAIFLRLSNDEWKKTDCPKLLADLIVNKEEWDLPHLTGIITAPTLREDGSILDKAGYDEMTGLYFCCENEDFLPVKEMPTLEDAKKALENLKAPLAEFPFVSEKDRSVVISMILTTLIRKSLYTSPMFGFTAPKMGTGKSLLPMVLVGMIATGSEVSPRNNPKTEEEAEKKYLSFLMSGSPIICIDNVEGAIQGENLCSILTGDKWEGGRLLGSNQMPKVSTRVTWAATGNNLVFRKDVSTRVLLCSLDAECERPEEREFKIDLRSWIPKHRKELIRDALTILRAFHIAGRPKPDGLKAFGRFEAWSEWVRSAIIWVGMEDPCATRDEIEKNDTARIELKSFLSVWMASIPDPVTSKRMVELAETNKDLKCVLSEVAGKKGEVTPKALSYFLRSIKGRWEDGMCVREAGVDRVGFMQWKIECNMNANFACLS
ncbi:MAG: DUF3854 domain-containing protein [Candidatus Brocadiae bacterium]|nr:DUF3854 domain-containing protein [Candidatus Brocadiia bacterium]